jgi:hypothetical protein
MQLLDSLQTQPFALPERLQASLQDIVSNIQIQSNLCISHPEYKPLELPEEVVTRFQQLPSNLQNKYLSVQLCNFLYGIYYNGYLKPVLAKDAEDKKVSLHQDLENNTYMGVDVVFYERLHSSNSGEGYYSPGWLVVKQETDGMAVYKSGLTLYVQRDRHLQPQHQAANVGDSVAIKMPKNLVQNGFYMAVGNAGPYTEGNIVRVYFNLTPEGAVGVMGSLTLELNALPIPFNFKALYNPSDYKRHDSAVLYFEKNHYKAVCSVLEKVYAHHQSLFQADVPLFTKILAPGLAIAEEPNQKFAEKESFGMNRCQIIANGLLEAWHQGDDSPEGRMSFIIQQFSSLGIELQHPYLNAHSEDIYRPFQL